jgi:hypothetical protein
VQRNLPIGHVLGMLDSVNVTTFGERNRTYLARVPGGVLTVFDRCQYCGNSVHRESDVHCWSCGAPVIKEWSPELERLFQS